MTISVDTVIRQARVLLQDERGSAFRYTDEQLVDMLNSFQKLVLLHRPEMFLASDFTTTDVAITGSLPLEEQYFQPALYYVVGTAMLREDEFSDDGRAVAMLNKSLSQLGIPYEG